MGRDPANTVTPDLFSTVGEKAADPSLSTRDAAKDETAPQRHILPKNLRHAVSQLSDGELDELFEVAFDEAKRRDRLPSGVKPDLMPSVPSLPKVARERLTSTDKRRNILDTTAAPLTRGQVSMIRAAFKAGITPSRIARQFGVSQSNVRKALAKDPSK